MADGLNKVELIGNLGSDPEFRTTTTNKSVVNFRMATGESWKDSSGNRQESTEWHRVVFWGRTAEIVRDHLKKGSKIYLEGKIKTRKWTDNDGKDQYTTEIVGNKFLFLDGKQGQGGGSQQQQQQQGGGVPPQGSFSGNNPNDDIPF